jgi:hypothetical protein
MKQAKSESPSDIVRWLQSETASLWPAILGSLSLRRSPCVRENCPACLSGEQHQSYVLYDRAEGRRITVCVPEELVPQVQRGHVVTEIAYCQTRSLRSLRDRRRPSSWVAAGQATGFCATVRSVARRIP